MPVSYSELQTNINRRFVLKMLVVLTLLKSTFSLASKSGSQTFKRTWTFKTTDQLKSYTSVDDFWNDHQDNIAYQLNAVFRQNGWLVNDMSELQKDGRTAYLTKEYTNKHYFELYNDLWLKLSQGNIKEGQKLYTSISDNHLF